MTDYNLFCPFLSQKDTRARGEGFVELVANPRTQKSPAMLANRTEGILKYRFNLVSVLTLWQFEWTVTSIQYDGCNRITIESYTLRIRFWQLYSNITADDGGGVSYLIQILQIGIEVS